MMEMIARMSPLVTARTAGAFYVLNIVTGAFAAVFVGKLVALSDAANVLATVCYLVITVLFYYLFRVVSRSISLLAALCSLVGCAVGILRLVRIDPFDISSLVFFGFYCLLIGYLIFRSTFLPGVLGALMAFAGLGWLTFAWPPLAHFLAPYNFAPGVLGEGALTLWLLAFGVNGQRWNGQAKASGIAIAGGRVREAPSALEDGKA
jgi:hypothetical protein